MKLIELIERVQNLYSRGVQSDDSRLENSLIYSKLKTARIYLVTNELEKRHRINPLNYSTINCVGVSLHPKGLCPCLPNIDCDVLRTDFKLPTYFGSRFDSFITNVKSTNGEVIFSETTAKKYSNKSGLKYPDNNPYYILDDSYLYLYNVEGIEAISVSFLAEDMISVSKFETLCGAENNTENNLCTYDLVEFPIEPKLIEPLIELAVTELVNIFQKTKEDETNDSKEYS